MNNSNRYTVLVVEDEFYETILCDMCNHRLLPSMPGTIGALASNDEYRWLVNEFNQKYADYKRGKDDKDLIEILVAGTPEKAIDVYKNREGKFDIVIIDVDLSKHRERESQKITDNFEGFHVYRTMCEFLYDRGMMNSTLFVMYTRSNLVLKSYAHLLIKKQDEYMALSKITSPMILAFGQPNEGGEFKQAEDRRDLLQRQLSGEAGKLLYELIAQQTVKLSREKLSQSNIKAEIKELLCSLETSFKDVSVSGGREDRKKWNELKDMDIQGWRFQHLFPIDIARVEMAQNEDERRSRVSDLRKKAFKNFRLLYSEFHEQTAKGELSHFDRLRKEPAEYERLINSVIKKYSELTEHHYHITPYWQGFVSQGSQNHESFKKWQEDHRKHTDDYELPKIYEELGLSVSSSIKPTVFFHSRTGTKLKSLYYCWRPDLEQMLKVINANARERGWKKNALLIAEGDSESEFWFDFQVNDQPMPVQDLDKAERKCKTTPATSDVRSEQLPELIRTVCDYYDGRVEILSCDSSGVEERISISNKSQVNRSRQTVSTTGFVGTKYRLLFPKGDS